MTYDQLVQNVYNCRNRWFAAIEAEEKLAIVWTDIFDFRKASGELKVAKREYADARKALREYKVAKKGSRSSGILAK